jgi:ribose transport system permease protein
VDLDVLGQVDQQVADRGPRAYFVLYEHGVYFLLLIIAVVAALFVQTFATSGNIKALLVSIAIEGLVAIGMTFVVISGSFVDLSVVGTVALSSVLSLQIAPHNVVLAILAGVGAGAGVGLVNGVIISRGGNPVLVTLAVQTVLSGIDLGLNGGNAVLGNPHGALQNFASGSVLSVPNLVIVFFVVALVGQVVLRQTQFGFDLYMVGANSSAARVAGVAVRRVLVGAFVISGVLAGLAGVLAGAYGNEADSNVGTGYDFWALTAVVVGGTSLFGGRGNVGRTVAGVLLIGIIDNVMILENLSVNWQPIVMGALIAIMVGLDVMLARRKL